MQDSSGLEPVSKEISFLTDRFRSFYQNNPVSDPPGVEFREFGFGVFGKKISGRHLNFVSHAEFNRFLTAQVPFFVSYSPAFYQYPANRPMVEKKWLHSDIVYEFDADDLALPCTQDHDFWECKSCHASGKGVVKACSTCGSQSIGVEQWVCRNCLESVKKQVFLLVDVIENDFGFSDGVELNFSGSKGFHIHLRGSNVQDFSARARIELLDFLTGTNLDLEALGFFESHRGMSGPVFRNSAGWSKKILVSLKSLLNSNDAAVLAAAGGVSHKFASKALLDHESVWDSISRGVFPNVGSKSVVFWRKVLDFLSERIALPVDRSTSMDQYKIIRVPSTLHGSTGLLAKKIPFNSFSSFNALGESVVFSDAPVKVHVNRTPRFELKDESFGPFENETVELPEYAAVFLLCRKAAVLDSKPSRGL